MRTQTITFEGLDTNPADDLGVEVADGFAGFDWDNMWALDASNLSGGYHMGIFSGTSVGGNATAGDTSFASDETFSLKSGYFTAADGSETITFLGFLDGVQVASKTVDIDTLHQQSINFGKNFAHIDAVTISLGGQMAMDDLVTHFDAPDDVAGSNVAGTVGDDVLHGTDGNDAFDTTQGAKDRTNGYNGNDGFLMGTAFAAADRIFGSNGVDSITLNGDYTGANAVVFTATTMLKVEDLVLTAGHSYALTTHDATVTDGRVLRVDASALGAGDALVFNGAAEIGGQLKVTGGAGDDSLTGGAANDVLRGGLGHDVLDLSAGGNDRAFGGDGENTVFMGAALTADDHIAGGGTTSVVLEGAYTLVMGSSTLQDIDFLRLQGAFDYNLTMNDSNVTDLLQVDAAGMTDALHGVVFSGSQENTGRFSIYGSAGADTFTGGAANDFFRGNAGADTFTGGGGTDFFDYDAAGDSTGAAFDTILDFTDDEFIDLPFALDTDAFNADVNAGGLSTATFDADLAAALGAAQLRVNSAVLFRPDSGNYVGKTFLVIDANGTAGYQAGEDYVIGIVFTGDLGGDNFV